MDHVNPPAAPERLAREENLSRLLMICGHRLYHSAAQGRTQTTVLHALHENGPTSQKELQDSVVSLIIHTAVAVCGITEKASGSHLLLHSAYSSASICRIEMLSFKAAQLISFMWQLVL